MRILFLCNEYPPTIHGGIGTFTRDIAIGLAKEGHDVSIWGLYNDINEPIFESKNNVKIFRHPVQNFSGRINLLYFLINFNLKLRSFLRKEEKFDIIECQEWQGLLPFGLYNENLVVRIHGASIFFDTLLKRKEVG